MLDLGMAEFERIIYSDETLSKVRLMKFFQEAGRWDSNHKL
jgi:hypothetical protein